MDQIEPEHPELFALKFGKITEPDFVYTRMSSIMDLIKPELSELSALKLENLPYLTLFTL